MRKLKILLICAHPGDAFDDSGGTLCRHAERGDEVTVVIMTHGARSHAAMYTDEKRKPEGARDEKLANMSVDQIAGAKREELIAAGKELGIDDVRVMDVEDDVLIVREDLIRRVGELIRDEKPDILITQNPLQDGGFWGTHPIVGQIVMLGVECAARWIVEEDKKPHVPSQIFLLGGGLHKSWFVSTAFHFAPDVYVDVTTVIERKIKAMDHLKSQRYDGPYARKRMETEDGHRGAMIDLPYAECFLRWKPEVCNYLPLDQSTLDTDKSWTGRVTRTSKMIAPYVPMPNQ